MFQETATWDLQTTQLHTSGLMKLYMLFLFIASFVAVVKFIASWLAFRSSRKTEAGAHEPIIDQLQGIAASLGRWIVLTLLAWGIFASASISALCLGMAAEKATNRFVLLSRFLELSQASTMAMCVILLLYLAGWYTLNRIEHLEA